MKRFIVVFLLLPLLSVAQKSFVINGELSGVKDKALVSLTDANNPKDTLAKSRVTNGKFVLKGSIAEPGLYNLNFSDLQKKGLLFLDNSKLIITGKSDEIQKLHVEGSASHKDFEEFQDIFNPLFSNLNQLSEQIKMVGITDELKTRVDSVSKDIQEAIDKFIEDKKESYVSPFLILVTAQLSDNTKLLRTRYSSLTENVQRGFYGKIIKEMLENSKIGAVGTTAIDFNKVLS